MMYVAQREEEGREEEGRGGGERKTRSLEIIVGRRGQSSLQHSQ